MARCSAPPMSMCTFSPVLILNLSSCIRMSDNHRSSPPPPPLPSEGSSGPSWEKMKCTEGKISSGHFWYTTFGSQITPPPLF